MSTPTPNDPVLIYFHEIVEPTVKEFTNDTTDRRRGCLACLVLASMTEHYFHAHPSLAAAGAPKFKADLRDQNKAVGWIADVANATKHVVRSQGRDKLGYEDVQTRAMGRAGELRAGWPIGGSEVLVKTGPGDLWRLSELVEAATAFWRDKLGLPPV